MLSLGPLLLLPLSLAVKMAAKTATTTLFSAFKLGKLELGSRLAMAPMTRSRALGNIPNDLMAEYYGQRAGAETGASLIITEGVAPSPSGCGYARIPGMW